MKAHFTYKSFSIILLTLFFSFCKKKNDITVSVYNYALGEPVSEAKIVITEFTNSDGIFSSKKTCQEKISGTTDQKGYCYFTDVKLKKSNDFTYNVNIKEVYGKSLSYNCGNLSSKLNINKHNEVHLSCSDFSANFLFNYKNILTPSIPGDSLEFIVFTPKYFDPVSQNWFGGDVAFIGRRVYGDTTYPFVNNGIINVKERTKAGKNVMYVYKKKMGVVTQTIDTIKIYPYETKTIEINW